MLEPQALLAVTDTEPALLPAVNMIELVVLEPLHPVPVTDQVYEVAPDTAGIVYVADEPGHGADGKITDVGTTGA